ncbi:MAG: hypothetical protein IJX92_01670 [Clostridia bacterium]|nr:hypothetical protein [Clostridia bacterium]
MNTLITLVKMQLKEKLNFKGLSIDAKKALRVVLSLLIWVLKFSLSTLACSVILFLVGKLPIFDELGRVPDTFMSVMLTVMLFLSVCSCTAGLTKAMYFSRDNAVLLTLPCKPIEVYLSKLIIFFFFELKKNFSFIIPLFWAYFITHGHDFIFYPWLLVCFLLLSILTVAIGALLSIPAMWLSNIFRLHKSLQTASIILVVTATIASLFFAVSLIPEDLNLRTNWDYIFIKIQEFLTAFAENLSPLYDLTRMIVGETVVVGPVVTVIFPLAATLLRFLVLLAVIALLTGLGLLIVQPLFYSMASKPFEYLKNRVKPKKNRALPSWFTCIYNEMLKVFKDSSKMFSNIVIMIAIPVLIFLLNSLFLAMNTDNFGDKMIISFNILIVLLISLNANAYAASIYSRDGRSAYLIKVQPKAPIALLIAKLLPTTLFCLVSFILTFGILLASTTLPFLDALCLMLAILLIYLAHLLYSAELDIMNPHTEIYAAIGEYESDPNELKSTAIAFLVSFAVTGITLLLLIEDASPVYPKLLTAGLLAFAYRARLFFSKVKVYYKEK